MSSPMPPFSVSPAGVDVPVVELMTRLSMATESPASKLVATKRIAAFAVKDRYQTGQVDIARGCSDVVAGDQVDLNEVDPAMRRRTPSTLSVVECPRRSPVRVD